jgi:hypothetical protein
VALYGAPKVATKELAAKITTVIDGNNHLSYIEAAAFAGGLVLCNRSSVTFAAALRRLGWTVAPAITEPPGRLLRLEKPTSKFA